MFLQRGGHWQRVFFSEDDYLFVMQVALPHLPLKKPVTIQQLKSVNVNKQSDSYSLGLWLPFIFNILEPEYELYKKAYLHDKCVRFFDINGYNSTDILRFVKNDVGKKILYIPSEKKFLRCFQMIKKCVTGL